MILDLDALEAAAKAATPGPRHTDIKDRDSSLLFTMYDGAAVYVQIPGRFRRQLSSADRELASISPQTVLALVAEVHRLQHAAAIVRELARTDPSVYVPESGAWLCGICGTGPYFESEEATKHEDECPWSMAVKWVARTPMTR